MTSSLAEKPPGTGSGQGAKSPVAVLFGAMADPDERTAAVRSKHAWIDAGRDPVDLLGALAAAAGVGAAEGVAAAQGAAASHGQAPAAGGAAARGPGPVIGGASIAVDRTAAPGEWAWLSPTPGPEHREAIAETAFARFVDDGGCLRLAEAVEAFVESTVLPAVPVMVGVDHSLTGGVLRALSRRHGAEDLAVIVLDAHTDAIPTTATAGAVHYDAETNPGSRYDAADPLLRDRPDSYNASTFLHHLIDEGTVDPRNLYLVGVADTPPSRARKIDDSRIQEYVAAYSALRKRGVTVLTRDEIATNPARVAWALSGSKAGHVYVSIDLDVGANVATRAVRFRDRTGLDAATLERLIEETAAGVLSKARLVGVDLMEFDVRSMERLGGVAVDPGVLLAARLLRRLLRTLTPSPLFASAHSDWEVPR